MKMGNDRLGFSLMEVMVAVFVFSIVAIGIASATMLTSRIAISNIYRSTAHATAQGYAEQLKSIDYDTIFSAIDDPTNNDIPTVGISLTSTDSSGQIQLEDPLTFGIVNEKNVVVDVDVDSNGNTTPQVMRMWFTVTGSDLSTTTNCWDALELRLEYEWELIGSGRASGNRFSDYIQIVKTKISEY